MEISPTQIMNPGILEYDDRRRRELARFQEAVSKAKFLDNNQRRKWQNLAYLLTNDQLEEIRTLLIVENLHRLKAQGKLEKLKSKEK